jgi:thiol-disulfide isomerase/thioredoxin
MRLLISIQKIQKTRARRKCSIVPFCICALFLVSVISAPTHAQSGDNAMRKTFADAGIRLLSRKISAPDFSLQPLAGSGNITLSALRGKVVFLNFWATWCPPGREEMPSMEILYQRYKGALEFVTVDMMEDKSAVSAFMRDLKLSFPVALDTDGRVSAFYGIQAIPSTFIIDKDGMIIASVVGGLNWSDPSIFAAFDLLLK